MNSLAPNQRCLMRSKSLLVQLMASRDLVPGFQMQKTGASGSIRVSTHGMTCNHGLLAGGNKSRITGSPCDQVFARTHSICISRHIAIRHHDVLECAVLVKE